MNFGLSDPSSRVKLGHGANVATLPLYTSLAMHGSNHDSNNLVAESHNAMLV